MKRSNRLKSGVILLASLTMSLYMVCAGLAADKVTLTYWTWPFHEEIPAGFAKAYPNIELEIVKLGAGDLHDKLLLALRTGRGAPDVTWILQRRFSEFAPSGGLTDLTSRVKGWRSEFEEGIFDMTLYEGKYYGVSMDKSPEIVLLRKDLYAEYGVDPNFDTWDEFIEGGQKFVAQGIYLFPVPFPSGRSGPQWFNMHLHSREGGIYTKDGKIKEDNPMMVEMLEWYENLTGKGKVGDAVIYKSPDKWARFKNDKYATWPINAPQLVSIKKWCPEQAGKWTVVSPPRWPDKERAFSGVWGGSTLAIPKESEKQEAAFDFVSWVTHTIEGQIAYKRDIGGLPVLKATYEDPRIAEIDPYYGLNPFNAILSIPPYYYFDWGMTGTLLAKQLDALILGQVSAQEAFDAFVSDVKIELGR